MWFKSRHHPLNLQQRITELVLVQMCAQAGGYCDYEGLTAIEMTVSNVFAENRLEPRMKLCVKLESKSARLLHVTLGPLDLPKGRVDIVGRNRVEPVLMSDRV